MTKLKWGMIGGGEGSQIGPAHRLGALADGLFEFSAAALDHRPNVGRTYAKSLGISEDRAYGDWKEMLTSCLLYTSPSPRDMRRSRMPSSA